MGVVQRLLPVAPSTAAQYSVKPLPLSLDVMTKARPWLTATELKPFVSERLVQIAVRPPEAQLTLMGSGDTPSVVAPRNCGQSVPWTMELPRSSKPKAPANTRDRRIGNARI